MREFPLPWAQTALPTEPQPLQPGPLACHDLTYSGGGTRLIDGISLSFPANGITAVMGPNGAGKSLLLRLLHGLVAPQSGTVTWHGAPIDDTTRARHAMVFQKPVLLRRSVAANVEFVQRSRGRRDVALRDAMLARVGLAGRARQPARLLSGGEQQRLALARALVTGPELLFLDEPTASLDPASAIVIEDILRAERRRGTKVILVTHDVGQARRLADDVVFLAQGQVAEHRRADAFFAAPHSRAARDYLAGRIVL